MIFYALWNCRTVVDRCYSQINRDHNQLIYREYLPKILCLKSIFSIYHFMWAHIWFYWVWFFRGINAKTEKELFSWHCYASQISQTHNRDIILALQDLKHKGQNEQEQKAIGLCLWIAVDVLICSKIHFRY